METAAIHLCNSPFIGHPCRLPDVRDLPRPDIYRDLLHWSTLGLDLNMGMLNIFLPQQRLSAISVFDGPNFWWDLNMGLRPMTKRR